jgi:hypothetical protein
MIPLNPRKARQMFIEMVRPSLPVLTCDDVLVYDFTDYYATLGAVVSRTFTDKDPADKGQAKGQPVDFLVDQLGQITSPLQFAAAMASLNSVALSKDERELVTSRLSGMLESMSADPRSFAAASDALKHAIGGEMAASYDKYVHKNPSGAECVGSPAVDRYWQSAAAKTLLEDGKKLRFGGASGVLSLQERTTREWLRQLTDYRKDLGDWSASDESNEADFFHEKALIYEALLDLIPTGAERDAVLGEYVGFLSGSNFQQQKPVEWFMQAREMFERVRDHDTAETGKILDSYRGSGMPVLTLYAAMERIFGSKVPAWVTPSN